jgi:hypothetical protein
MSWWTIERCNNECRDECGVTVVLFYMFAAEPVENINVHVNVTIKRKYREIVSKNISKIDVILIYIILV